MLQKSYYEFILEKKEDDLLELITEALFIMSGDMSDIMQTLVDDEKDYSEIARCFVNLDLEDVDTNVSYLDLGDSNSSISFLDPKNVDKIRDEKGWTIRDAMINMKGNMVKVGRLTKKVIKLYNSVKKRPLWIGGGVSIPPSQAATKEFSDQEIEKFVNAYKAQYDFNNNIMNNFELVSGQKITSDYSGDNYWHESDGQLGSSCMRYDDAQSYFDIYTENKSVNLLVLRAPNKKVMGRAIVWSLSGELSGDTFMDRIYTNRDSDVELFIKYAKINNWILKEDQDMDPHGPFFTPEDDYEDSIKMKLEVKVHKTSFDDAEDESFPYMDTMKYYYWETGFIRNWGDKNLGLFVKLDDTDGWCSCDKCRNGRLECSVCDGYGTVDCDHCGGDRYLPCNNCDGSGVKGDVVKTKCPDCDDGQVNCPECRGDGTSECGNCKGTTEVKCDQCGGFVERY